MYDIWKGLHIFQPQVFYQEDAKDTKGQQKKIEEVIALVLNIVSEIHTSKITF